TLRKVPSNWANVVVFWRPHAARERARATTASAATMWRGRGTARGILSARQRRPLPPQPVLLEDGAEPAQRPAVLAPEPAARAEGFEDAVGEVAGNGLE